MYICAQNWIEMNSRDLISLLMQAGFEPVSVKGSHHKLRRGSQIVIVPHPKKDLPLGTVKAILRQAGLKES